MTHRIYIFLFLFSAFKIAAQETTTTEEVQDTFKTPQYEVVYDDVFLSKKETKWLVKVDFLPYIENLNDYTPNRREGSIEFERKVGKQFSLNAALNWNSSRANGAISPFSVSIEPRFYFVQKGQVRNLNGIYASLMYEYGKNFSALDKSKQQVYGIRNNAYGIGLGLQKRVFNNWYFNYQLGYVAINGDCKTYPNFEEKPFKSYYINNRFSLGLAFGGGGKSKIEACEVFRCFEEEKNLFKIDIRGLFKSVSGTGFSSVLTVANETKLGKTAWSVNNQLTVRFRKNRDPEDEKSDYTTRRTNGFTFMVEPRYYFNLKKRIAQGKSANNLSGFYTSLGLGVQVTKGNSTTQIKTAPNYYKSDYTKLEFFSVAKIGLQKRVFKNGYFDIALAPIEFVYGKTTEKNLRRRGGQLVIEDYSRDFKSQVTLANITPFFDFKIGFAF